MKMEMKRFKKYFGVAVIGLGLCFTGCAKETVLENDNYKFTVDSTWKKIPVEIMPGSISVAKNNDESINVLKMPTMPELAGVTIEEYQDMVEINLTAQPGCEVISNEIEDTNLGEVIYIEAKVTTTKEMVQQSIDAGIITQEAVDAAGGMEQYEKGMTLNQLAVYYLEDGEVIGFTGQTANGVSIDDTKAQLDKIISNIEIK